MPTEIIKNALGNIYYEATLKYAKEDEQGLLKMVAEKYLIEGVNHADAEETAYRLFAERVRGDFKVSRLVNSNISEIFDADGEFSFYKCKYCFHSVDSDSGKEKKFTDTVLINADGVNEAYYKLATELRNVITGWEIISVVKSPVLEVFYVGTQESE